MKNAIDVCEILDVYKILFSVKSSLFKFCCLQLLKYYRMMMYS